MRDDWKILLKIRGFFSDRRKYRYGLWRIWDGDKSLAMQIGLNPSTADETSNDPTIIRCKSFSRSWGYGGVLEIKS